MVNILINENEKDGMLLSDNDTGVLDILCGARYLFLLCYTGIQTADGIVMGVYCNHFLWGMQMKNQIKQKVTRTWQNDVILGHVWRILHKITNLFLNLHKLVLEG